MAYVYMCVYIYIYIYIYVCIYMYDFVENAFGTFLITVVRLMRRGL